MNCTGYISVVETSISGCCHFEIKITQTLVFLDFLETISDGIWNLKVHKNQCFMKDQLQYVENASQYILRPQDELHWVYFYG